MQPGFHFDVLDVSIIVRVRNSSIGKNIAKSASFLLLNNSLLKQSKKMQSYKNLFNSLNLHKTEKLRIQELTYTKFNFCEKKLTMEQKVITTLSRNTAKKFE